MMGVLEQGEVQTRCEVGPDLHKGSGFRGRLSLPGYGTKFTENYPDKEDAVAALVDLRREAFGPHVHGTSLPAIEFKSDVARAVADPLRSATIGQLTDF